MPPIRKGDGTPVAAKGISQIRTGDGRILFDGPAIPDTVVWQFNPSTFSTGDEIWTDDVGENDINVTGEPQSGTLSNGNPSVVSDGSDDHGTAPVPSDLESSDINSFAVEIAVEYSAGGFMEPLGIQNDNDSQKLEIFLNADFDLNNEDGNVMLRIDSPNGDRLYQAPDTNPNLDDGERHTILFNVNDASNNDVEVFIDNSQEPSSGGFEESPSNFGSWDIDMGYFGRNDSGGASNRFDGATGLVRWHDQPIDDTTI